ncbi:RsfA family transcriptional regulator [Oceanobacillus sp. 143]|uniref:RsfA family transcriptional regulator n=1 Tax=Oceanobacillus zhaokaii TaxID=2052660 RepID=A0A345PHT1_9BACI|nr:RsfA family transcriptional regulator [Oceanobacillus zhaokaii]AXI09561.1 RsfA family transcriptional regulator [Oceanobacillus zhaokaii]QGS69921.1 RsfA family transcriptional regulator [Oceanobacillus sp. 143]
MVKVRQDAWSHEDDLLLAETVLRHIREGSTQLNAFEEVGDKLNRTSAACGFRWNAEVRMKYDSAIDLAKRQRKEKKRAIAKQAQKTRNPIISLPPTSTYEEYSETEEQSTLIIEETAPAISMDMVIQFLHEVKKDYYASNQSKVSLESAHKENMLLKEEINKLEKKLSETETQLSTIQEDYQAFIQIMDRARKMTVLDDQGTMKAPTFRMDKNGNLQQLAQGSN